MVGAFPYRATVFGKPARGRFKAYYLWLSPQRRRRRMAIPDQPFHGFRTVAEAWDFVDHMAAMGDVLRPGRDTKGTPIPRGELEAPRPCPETT